MRRAASGSIQLATDSNVTNHLENSRLIEKDFEEMGVLGAYFENVPVGLLPATTDVTWVWAVMLLLSGLGVAGVSMLGKKRENE